jgi:hypothetical protein
MYEHIQFLHHTLSHDCVIRLVLLRNDWELSIKKTDNIYKDGSCLIIEHKNGNRVIVNMEHITFACTMAAGRRYYE